jgi:hypothetical protein
LGNSELLGKITMPKGSSGIDDNGAYIPTPEEYAKALDELQKSHLRKMAKMGDGGYPPREPRSVQVPSNVRPLTGD